MRFQIKTTEFVKPPCKAAVEEGGNWYVEIATLADLMALIEETGQWIIVTDRPSIEIYDGYRE